MRTTRSLALALAATMAVAGCSSSGDGDGGDAGGEVPEVAATVGDVEIPSERIEEIADLQVAALASAEQGQAPTQLEAARQALSAEIQLRAVEKAVEDRFGLDITDEDVDAALEEQIAVQGGEESFDQLAEDAGLTPADARDFARDNVYITVLVEYVQEQLAQEGGLTDEELRAQYDADRTQFQSASVSHILVATEQEAEESLQRLEDGEDFSELATELSTDPGSAQNGGSLGEAPRGSYVPAFSEAVYSDDTEIGEVVGPVETQFGFHLIRVDERTTPAFEDVRDQLESQLVGAQFEDFLQSVFDGVTVEIDPYYGTWDAGQRMVVPAADGGAEDGDASEEQDAGDGGDEG